MTKLLVEHYTNKITTSSVVHAYCRIIISRRWCVGQLYILWYVLERRMPICKSFGFQFFLTYFSVMSWTAILWYVLERRLAIDVSKSICKSFGFQSFTTYFVGYQFPQCNLKLVSLRRPELLKNVSKIYVRSKACHAKDILKRDRLTSISKILIFDKS